MYNTSKNPTNQVKFTKKFKGFREKDKFSGSLSHLDFRSFLASHPRKKLLHYTIYVFVRFGWGCENVRPSRGTILDTINQIFGTSYTNVDELSRVTKLMENFDLIKKGQHMFGYNMFGTNSYLLAQSLLWRRYLIVLRDFLPYNRELELMIAGETAWSQFLKDEISRRKQRYLEERRLSNTKENYNILITYHQNLIQPKKAEDVFKSSKQPAQLAVIGRQLLEPSACLNKKRNLMQAIPSYIQEIKSINLTDAGKISLSPFSKKVIGMADKKTAAKKPTGNPFLYFVKVCNLVSRDLGEEPKWALVTQLSLEMKVSPEAPKLENNEVNSIKGEDKTKRTTAWKPISDDPYYRPPAQREIFERQRTKREVEWSKMADEDPDKLERIEARSQEYRNALGLNEQGERIAEPSEALLATPFRNLYHSLKKEANSPTPRLRQTGSTRAIYS